MRKKKEESPNMTFIRDEKIEPYFICKDSHGYTVYENIIPDDRFVGDKKMSQDYTKPIGHYNNFGSCLQSIVRQKTNNGSNYESINEYLGVFREIENNIKELTEIGI